MTQLGPLIQRAAASLLAVSAMACGPGSSRVPAVGGEVLLYAAASLGDALTEIGPVCEARTGARLVVSLAGSNELARQILAAERADLFLSADEAWVDRVERAGRLEPGTRRRLLSNRLVVVAPRGSVLAARGPADLAAPEIRRLALADTRAVPAGIYAKEWLEGAGVWRQVEERVVPALDVRAALAMVATGAADAGIVYRTDAASSDRVRTVLEIPPGEHAPITYVLAMLSPRPHQDGAVAVAACLAGGPAAEVFARHGFIPLEGIGAAR